METEQRNDDYAAMQGGVLTRIYHGGCGRIVLTVQAETAHAASLLARICGAAVEAGVYRAYRESLKQD